jgi:hypothetical protein
VTSRNRLTGLVASEGAHPTTLDVIWGMGLMVATRPIG